MVHDFKRFPELTNSQMEIYYFDSPHKQITEDFTARVVGVHDGDTIRVEWRERDFTFPIRFANTAAPELNEEGGKQAQQWLEQRLLGKEVEVVLSKQRVEKWGRLLAFVHQGGQDVGDEETNLGLTKTWAQRDEGKIKNAFKSE